MKREELDEIMAEAIRTRREDKALSMKIPEVVHHKVKIAATLQHTSMTKYILQAVIDKLIRDKQYE